MKKTYYLLIISLLLTITGVAQSYKIEVKVKGVENQDLILGYHKGGNLMPYDTVKADKNGYAVFKGKEPLRQGLYFIFLPSKTYFDFIVGKDQTFYIENDTADIYSKMKVKGCDENTAFIDYHNFLMEQNKKMEDLRAKYQQTKDEKEKADIEAQMKDVSKKYEQKYQEIVSKHPDWFFSTFLKATQQIIVPDSITDQHAKYEYYKTHYFDNFDISDTRLLYTPFYDEKIETYLDKVVAPVPDSLTAAIDMILGKVRHDSVAFRYTLSHLFNKYAKSQLMIAENVYVHLADIFINEANWISDSIKNELKTKIVRKKNCLIGNEAKPLHMFILPSDTAQIEALRIPLEDMKARGLEIEKDQSRTFEEKLPDLSELIGEYIANFPQDIKLYNTNTKYTILWFMSPDCSHCKVETPAFFRDVQNKLKDVDVQVWCIYLERNTDDWNRFSNDIGKWFDFVEKHKFYDPKWYNVWNPFDNYRFKYDISSTPVLYLLDKDKKILAKRIGYDQAIDIILDLEKAEK